MERVTSKTMDAYVEFMTLEDAMRAVEKHTQNQLSGRPTRLGDRPVDMQLSSQASLMKDLFPVAAGVVWKGATPEIQPFKPNEPWDNFKGFISPEEMFMLVRHVEVPHRVSLEFASCPLPLFFPFGTLTRVNFFSPSVPLFQGMPPASV